MNKTQAKTQKRVSRHKRIRAKAIGTAVKPRLAVFKSNTAVYAQLIDDSTHTTLAAADTRKLKGDSLTARASELGSVIAKKAKDAGIEAVVFDRGGFKYQGSIAALADSARSGGLTF
ncbi:MAG: 50S ribosomal protein L18 [Candidatus Paceibacterota bacterium]